jgi:hypothetical protein
VVCGAVGALLTNRTQSVEVTFCALPDSVPEIVMADIVSRIPGG